MRGHTGSDKRSQVRTSRLRKGGSRGHIKHCVRDGIEHGDADKTIESFTKAVERFSNMS